MESVQQKETTKCSTKIFADKPSESPTIQAVNYFCQDLDLPPTTQFPVRLRTPIFIGHGLVDEKVSVKLGRQAASYPSALDVDVEYKELANLA